MPLIPWSLVRMVVRLLRLAKASYCTVEPPVSDHPKCQAQVVACIAILQKPLDMTDMLYSCEKSISREIKVLSLRNSRLFNYQGK